MGLLSWIVIGWVAGGLGRWSLATFHVASAILATLGAALFVAGTTAARRMRV